MNRSRRRYVKQGNKRAVRFSDALFAKMTPTEQIVFDTLVSLRLKFQAQKAIGPFIVDFYVNKPKCVIEIDGGYHYNRRQQAKDKWRQDLLLRKLCGQYTRFLRFCDDEVNRPDFKERFSWQIYRALHPWANGKIRPSWEMEESVKIEDILNKNG